MRLPLIPLAVCFGAGVAGAWWLKPPPALIFALAAGGGAAFWALRRRSGAANGMLLLLMLLAGAGRAAADGRMPAQSLQHMLGTQPRTVTCEGIFARDTSWYPPGGGRGRRQGWMEVERVRQGDGWSAARGRVQLRLPAHAGLVRTGDRLSVSGALRMPRASQDRFNETAWLWTEGACGVLSVSDSESISVLRAEAGLGYRFQRRAEDFRVRLRQRALGLLPAAEVGYLEALILGEGRGIPRKAKEAFRRSGTIHLLVVSGFQVGLIGSMMLVLLSLARAPRAIRYCVTAAVLVAYCALTGGAPPVLRATVAGVLLCLARLQGREAPPLNTLGGAALVILAFDPRALADVSLQLSFAAVLGLLVGAHCCAVLTCPQNPGSVPGTKGRFGTWYRWLVQPLAVSLGAWAAITPLVAWHMGTVSWVAPLANLAAVPLGSALVADGVLLCALSLLLPSAAAPFAAAFTLLAQVLAGLAAWAAALPGASFRW